MLNDNVEPHVATVPSVCRCPGGGEFTWCLPKTRDEVREDFPGANFQQQLQFAQFDARLNRDSDSIRCVSTSCSFGFLSEMEKRCLSHSFFCVGTCWNCAWKQIHKKEKHWCSQVKGPWCSLAGSFLLGCYTRIKMFLPSSFGNKPLHWIHWPVRQHHVKRGRWRGVHICARKGQGGRLQRASARDQRYPSRWQGRRKGRKQLQWCGWREWRERDAQVGEHGLWGMAMAGVRANPQQHVQVKYRDLLPHPTDHDSMWFDKFLCWNLMDRGVTVKTHSGNALRGRISARAIKSSCLKACQDKTRKHLDIDPWKGDTVEVYKV